MSPVLLYVLSMSLVRLLYVLSMSLILMTVLSICISLVLLYALSMSLVCVVSCMCCIMYTPDLMQSKLTSH